MHSYHPEQHVIQRSGWLRAAVLGANDGIISVTSLVLGIAASGASAHTLMISSVAALISGAVSMAAGEYISVQSQADIEQADLKTEARELENNPHLELKELTEIYIQRGVDPDLAQHVAMQLSAHNALEAHARDEIGIHEITAAKPLQAAYSSALSFAVGALLPTLCILLSPRSWVVQSTASIGILSLALLGALSSYVAGTSIFKGSIRVCFWGIMAMLFSSWIGSLFQLTA